MIVNDSTGREVELSLIHGRYEDDIQIGEAVYVEGIGEVSDEEMEYIYDTYATELYEQWMDNARCAAEYFYEGER